MIFVYEEDFLIKLDRSVHGGRQELGSVHSSGPDDGLFNEGFSVASTFEVGG